MDFYFIEVLMTKERKIAIKIWEDIKQRILADNLPSIAFFKSKRLITEAYGVSPGKWDSNCWFCQYVRRDYEHFWDYWEGTGKGLGEEGCNFCPLAKAHPLYNPSDAQHDCGCMLPGAPYNIASNMFCPKEERAAACDKIIKALKGEKIEIAVQEAI
jgi:hypothetical protein